jgi:hypothetical protein
MHVGRKEEKEDVYIDVKMKHITAAIETYGERGRWQTRYTQQHQIVAWG